MDARAVSAVPVQRTLFLLRHAKAEQVPGKPDHARELAPRGRRDAGAVGQWLSTPAPGLVLDLCLCSTSERTRQTLAGVRGGGAAISEVLFDKRIYNADAGSLLEVLHEVSDSVNNVLMIGHSPGVPALTAALVQEGTASIEASRRLSGGFPTSGLAVLGFGGSWAALAPERAGLRDFVVPRG